MCFTAALSIRPRPWGFDLWSIFRAENTVRRAAEALRAGLTPDAVLTDAEEALAALGEVSGRTLREDLVEAVFSRFCVGK